MIEFGETLRRTREEKGLTVSEVAQRTHMLVQQVEALEKEDFSKIAAPIYGRGFVKLYCEAVGIENPKPLVDEFMDIFSGNRPPTIRMRQPAAEQSVNPPDAPAERQMKDEDAWIFAKEEDAFPDSNASDDSSATPAVVVPEPPQIEPQHIKLPAADSVDETSKEAPQKKPYEPDSLFDFSLEAEVVAAPKESAETGTSPIHNSGTDTGETSLNQPIQKKRGPSKYAAPQPLEYESGHSFRIPPPVIRLGVLILAALLLIWMVFSGISCLYDTTMSPDTDTKTEKEQLTEAPAAPAAHKRTPMKLTPLFID